MNGGYLCNAIAVPDAKQQNLAAVGIFKNVIDAVNAGDFEEAWTARIGTHFCANAQKRTQLGELLRRMVPQVFQNGRLLRKVHYHGRFRRASESPHIDKDVVGVKMFHAFLLETGYFVSKNFHL